MKRQDMRNKIVECMTKYKDEFGVVDTSLFRKENPDIYAKIPYYFGKIESALAAVNGEVEIKEDGGSPTNKLTLRNSLCYDMLNALRKKHTLEEIGNMYGVSRMNVNQLFQSLDQSIGARREHEMQFEVSKQNF